MSEITYVRGDATAPPVKGVKLIAHVCRSRQSAVTVHDHGEGQ